MNDVKRTNILARIVLKSCLNIGECHQDDNVLLLLTRAGYRVPDVEEDPW